MLWEWVHVVRVFVLNVFLFSFEDLIFLLLSWLRNQVTDCWWKLQSWKEQEKFNHQFKVMEKKSTTKNKQKNKEAGQCSLFIIFWWECCGFFCYLWVLYFKLLLFFYVYKLFVFCLFVCCCFLHAMSDIIVHVYT